MITDRARLLGGLGILLLVTGCAAQDLPLQRVDNWGEANRQTFAAQIVDPAPEYDTLVPITRGDHAVAAADRYRTGTVKEPKSERVSNASGSGSTR